MEAIAILNIGELAYDIRQKQDLDLVNDAFSGYFGKSFEVSSELKSLAKSHNRLSSNLEGLVGAFGQDAVHVSCGGNCGVLCSSEKRLVSPERFLQVYVNSLRKDGGVLQEDIDLSVLNGYLSDSKVFRDEALEYATNLTNLGLSNVLTKVSKSF